MLHAMERLREMNKLTEERERFRRPCQTSIDPYDRNFPSLRSAALHEVNFRRQGRPALDTKTRGIIRLQISPDGRYCGRRIQTITSYPIMGDNAVEIVRYTEPKQSVDKGLVWINRKQYFKGVPPEVWHLYLGGCQICQKWLKDREGRSLSNKDIRQFQRIVMALKEMMELMAGIDAVLQHRRFSEGKSPNAVHPLGQV